MTRQSAAAGPQSVLGRPAPAQPFPCARVTVPASGAHDALMNALQDGHLGVLSQGRTPGFEHRLSVRAVPSRVELDRVARRDAAAEGANMEEARPGHDRTESGGLDHSEKARVATLGGNSVSSEHSENERAPSVSHLDTVSRLVGRARMFGSPAPAESIPAHCLAVDSLDIASRAAGTASAITVAHLHRTVN